MAEKPSNVVSAPVPSVKQSHKKKKIRRGLGKKKHSNLIMFSANSDGLKSKIDCFKNEVSTTGAAIFTVQETEFSKKGKLKINGFKIFEAIRTNKKGGGTLIGVHKSLNPMLIKEYSETFELLVVEIKIKNLKVRVMSGYGPQENWKEDDRLPFFSALEDEIYKAEFAGISVLIQMDANSKLGSEIIPNDPHDRSQNGKILAGIIQRHQLSVVNGTEKCHGLITRQRNNEASVIDFVIVSNDLFEDVDSLLIDEAQNHALVRYSKSKKGSRVQKSDHNSMITTFNIDWDSRKKKERIELFNLKNKECQKTFNSVTSEENLLSSQLDRERFGYCHKAFSEKA